VLLFSGATAVLPGRLELLSDLLPLPVLEVSHFLSSVIGMSLLILARGLQRRLDAAYWLTLVLLIAGAVAQLLKGILAVALAPAHRLFYRRASMFDVTFSFGWMLACATVLGCTVWLVFFSYQHVEYSRDLWWQFSFYHGNAPRALRALVGATGVALLFALTTLIRSARPRPTLPDQAVPFGAGPFGTDGRQEPAVRCCRQSLHHVWHRRPQLGRHGRSGRQ
jgi:phosphatidylglycerol lysyltransferase